VIDGKLDVCTLFILEILRFWNFPETT